MSYESVGEVVRGQGGHVFNPRRYRYRVPTSWARGRMMGLGTETMVGPSNIMGFYLLPGAIGLLGLLLVAKIFGR